MLRDRIHRRWPRLGALTILLTLIVQPLSVHTQAHRSLPTVAGLATPATPALRPGYAGDQACLPCHRDQTLTYSQTAHHWTSQPANRRSVLGSFLPGMNVLPISDPKVDALKPALFFKMEARDNALWQTAETGWGDRLITKSEPIDVVTGSGTRGQTYLYWQGDRLFELPVSYWTATHRWVNSPGYVDGTADFSRPIFPGCLECHATHIVPRSSDAMTNSYDKATLQTGISCETCHGPAAQHVARFSSSVSRQARPGGTAILNPSGFSRDRQVDACAYCHSGIQRQALAPAFSFVPGRPLSDYFKALPADQLADHPDDHPADHPADHSDDHPDVHGNQVGLLQRSRCYRSSPAMSCSTCHNTHAPEKAAASYSTACLKCHQWTACGIAAKLGNRIVENCIDCHMPLETTRIIASESAGETVRAKMRNHWIKVYPDAIWETHKP